MRNTELEEVSDDCPGIDKKPRAGIIGDRIARENKVSLLTIYCLYTLAERRGVYAWAMMHDVGLSSSFLHNNSKNILYFMIKLAGWLNHWLSEEVYSFSTITVQNLSISGHHSNILRIFVSAR